MRARYSIVCLATVLFVPLVAPLLAAAPVSIASDPRPIFASDVALRGAGGHALRWPIAVAARSSQELGVIDGFGARLLVFRSAGNAWEVSSAVELPAAPRDLVVCGDRYVIALRGRTELAVVDGTDGSLSWIALPAALRTSTLAVDVQDDLLVFDASGKRAVHLTTDGAVAAVKRQTPIAGTATALVESPSGGYVVAYAERSSIDRLDASGRLLDTWVLPGSGPVPSWPTDLVIDGEGHLIVSDRHGHRVVSLTSTGLVAGVGSKKGWNDGELLFPAGLELLPDGRLAIVDQGNGRVQLFRPVSRSSAP